MVRCALLSCGLQAMSIFSATGAVEANVETYGLTAAGLQAAINYVASQGGGVVRIPSGVTVDLAGGAVVITTPRVDLKGSGDSIIKNGTVIVGAPASTYPVTYNLKIEGITFSFDVLKAGNHAIKLQNARKGIIAGCAFQNCDYSIWVPPILNPFFQHVNRFQISNNRFDNCNFALRFERDSNATTSFQTADMHFVNNTANCNVSHISGVGVDGLIVSGNTLLFPGHEQQSQTKVNNIFLNKCSWIIIAGNSLYNAGMDSITLSNFQMISITGNSIMAPGQRAPGSGIRLTGGTFNAYNLGTVQGNTILFPTENGITIGTDCGSIAVTGNQVRAPGWAANYYGSMDLSTIQHHGIMAGAATSNVIVMGNMLSGAPTKNISVLGENSQVSQSGEWTSMTVNASPVDLSGFFGSTITLSYGSAGTISSIVGGKPGQVVGFCGTNPIMTFAHSSNMRLKGAVDTTLPINSYLYLKCVNTQGNTTTTGNAWVEVSRNY